MTDKYKLKFEPMGMVVEAALGETILDAAARRNVAIRSDCGGLGVCGKCRVIVEPADNLEPLTEAEQDMLTAQQVADNNRFACQARIKGPLTVTVPEELADSQEARGKTGIGGSYPLDSGVETIYLAPERAPEPENGHSTTLVDWLTDRVRRNGGQEIEFKDPDVMRQLALNELLESDVTLVNHDRQGITAVLPGRTERSLGVAVDLGTTTIAAYTCDLKTGQVLDSIASVNPQRRYGEDVISRISRTENHDDGLASLQKLAAQGVNHLIEQSLKKIGAGAEDIAEVAVVGNTTMEQLFTGFHPHSLGVNPYLPVNRLPPYFNAAGLGLALNPATPVHVFPVVSGFIGGDTMAVILADEPHRRDEITLIVDIGTNGEVVLGNREGLWVTSCATGPALEGAQISCGMRAVSGAIHRVDIDPDNLRFNVQVLGGNGRPPKPTGVCGSGVIDAVAAMRRAGLVQTTGRMKEGMPGVVINDNGVGDRVVLVPAEQSATGTDITITLQDIRQIQLAKAALEVGIEFLMRKAGVDHVDRTVLTGAFGAKFDWRNAVDIGMLPKQAVTGRVMNPENLAGVGVIMALVNKKRRHEAAQLAREIKFLELAQEPDFAMRFPEATGFPELN